MANLGNFDGDDVMDGFDTEESPVSKQAATVVQNIERINEELDNELSEVEKRLEVAAYYRLLLNDSVFNDNSEAAQRVNEEIHGFVRQRLGVLVGIRSERKEQIKEEPLFTKEEVVALKAVAAKVMKQPAIVVPKPVVPEIKKVAAPEPVKVTKFETKKKPGRPAKAKEPEQKLPEGVKVGDILDSKGNVIKKNARFKTIVAPDGSQHDLEITDQTPSASARPPMTKQEMEMVMEQQANQAVARFSPSAAVAATAVITGSKNEEN